MNPKLFLWLITALLLFPVQRAEAQQPARVPRIGYLAGASFSSNKDRVEAFRQGLRELGYVEGQNIVIEYRYAEGKPNRLLALAAELVRHNVDVIVTAGPAPTRPAKEATSTIPIIMAFDNDPVGNGFVVSLARPGGNITGLSTLAPKISGKRLEILKEIVPKLSHVAVIRASTEPDYPQVVRETELAAAALGLRLQYVEIQEPKDIETAFQVESKGRAEAVLVLNSPVLNAQRNKLPKLRQRIGCRRYMTGENLSKMVALFRMGQTSPTYPGVRPFT